MNALPASAQKVQDAARALGLDITVAEMAVTTRTAEDAAAAVPVLQRPSLERWKFPLTRHPGRCLAQR